MYYIEIPFVVSNIVNLWFTSFFPFSSNLDLAITSIQENVANYDISLDNTICSIYSSSGLACCGGETSAVSTEESPSGKPS